MRDLEITLENKPGSLALMGETLGKHKISLEGGGVFANGETAIAHFLVSEGERARTVLSEVGINVVRINEVIIQRLRQDVPGQLGMFCRKMADAGVNIRVQYSDHDHHLIVVVDDYVKAQQVSDAWMNEWWG
ncbi:hypothetical protein ACX0G7_10410 [Flavitalea antarctica]